MKDGPIVDTVSLVGNRAKPRGVAAPAGPSAVELVDPSCTAQRDTATLAAIKNTNKIASNVNNGRKSLKNNNN